VDGRNATVGVLQVRPCRKRTHEIGPGAERQRGALGGLGKRVDPAVLDGHPDSDTSAHGHIFPLHLRRARRSSPEDAFGGDIDSVRVQGRAPSPAETWDAFFSDFYLRAYANDERQDEAQAQALAAARLAGCPDGGDLLDVPCGFGRHSVPLARASYHVVGVDRSKALLAEAERRSGGAPWPRLVRADYRELPFAGESFDAALNLFTSLGYLGDEQDTRVLSEIRRVLRPGARLVIETMHRDLLVREFHEQDWKLLGAGRLLLEQRTFDAGSGLAQTTQTLIDASGERDSRSFTVRVYTATELLAMLTRAGFEEAKCYGDLDGAPFEADTRLVIVARG
jgi:SAM-dependent methyltransferase